MLFGYHKYMLRLDNPWMLSIVYARNIFKCPKLSASNIFTASPTTALYHQNQYQNPPNISSTLKIQHDKQTISRSHNGCNFAPSLGYCSLATIAIVRHPLYIVPPLALG